MAVVFDCTTSTMKHTKFLVTVALFTVITALCQTLLVFPIIAGNETAVTVAQIRVGSYNIQNGSGVDDDFTVIAKDITDAGLDIVGLQEVDKFTTRCPKDTMAELGTATGYHYSYSKAISLQGGEYGIGLLSKYPIISYETILLPSTSEQRVVGHAVIEISGIKVDVFNTHLAWPSKTERANQFKKLEELYSTRPYAILIGDLNSCDPAEFSVPFALSNFANGLENSYITNEEDGAIDNIISTASTIHQTATGMVLANGHTDHNMLWADLEIKSEASLKSEDGGVRFYENDNYLTGLQKIGFDTVYFDPATGLMAKELDGYDFKVSTACGITVYRQPYVKEGPGIYMHDGTDVTDKLTDGNYTAYISEVHWYSEYTGYLWTVENNRLIVGGNGTVDKNDTFVKLADEIKEIVILPNSVSAIDQNAFAGLYNAEKIVVGTGVNTVGSGAFNTGTKKLDLYLPAGLTLNDNVTAGTSNVTTHTMDNVTELTVSPSGNGIVNENGKTLLKLQIEGLTLAEDDRMVLIYTDGERLRENGKYMSAAMKYTEIVPMSAQNGEFIFDICNAEGDNQFIPCEDSSYIVTVQIWNKNNLKAEGKTKQGSVKCEAVAIYDKLTAVPPFASQENYIQMDLGKSQEIEQLFAYMINSGSRYTKWMAYGTNDPSLPLSKWTYLTGKYDTTSNTADTESLRTYPVEKNSNGNYPSVRYIRFIGTYDSARWSVFFTEVGVVTAKHEHTYTGNWVKVDDNNHERVCVCGDKQVEKHTWDDGVVIKEVTAEEFGEVKYTCTGCGATKITVIDKLDPPVTGDNTAIVFAFAAIALFAAAVIFKNMRIKDQ